MFLVDDFGWTDLACFGSDFYKTPNVDRMAAEGMRFTDAYATCTVCSPTRASLMTGKYPARLHLTDYIPGHSKPYARLKIPDWTQYLPLDEYTIAEALHDNGYATAHVGKWHLGSDKKYWPQNQGFDINVGGFGAGQPIHKNGGGGYFPPYKNPELPDGPPGEYLTERTTAEACKFIDQHKNGDKPFFLNYWLYSVHLPLQAKEDKIQKYQKLVNPKAHQQNPVYAAMVEHMDDALGSIMAKLKEDGLDNNTIIIFYSDNGGLVGNGYKFKITSNYPLRSGKGDMYEGGVRVPFIIRWPGKIKPGTVNHAPIISVDMYPTILSLTGSHIAPDKKQSIDGIDISQTVLNNKPLPQRALYWHYPHYHTEGASPYSAIRLGDWKLIEIFENQGLELYNLKDDIGETNNLYNKNPKKANELYAMLKKWRNDVGAQMPAKNPQYDPARVNQKGKDKPEE